MCIRDRWRDLPQAIRGLVLELAVDASPDVFARILHDAPTEPDRARREEMFAALAGVRDTARQLQVLALVIDPKLDIRETLDILYVAAEPANQKMAQQFFREHKDE